MLRDERESYKKKRKKKGFGWSHFDKKKKKVDHNVNGFILRRRVQ
jgi:hypothetical protein